VWKERTRRVEGDAEVKVEWNSSSDVISSRVDIVDGGCLISYGARSGWWRFRRNLAQVWDFKAAVMDVHEGAAVRDESMI
jgi:hypothetical protein